MKIKEIEKLTGLSRANIRFYEKEGLLSPRRTENRYRDYDEEDLRRLRTILVLRKLDLPLEDVRRVLVGELSPSEAARQQSLRLQTQLQETKSARELCRMLELKDDSISSFQPEAYLEEMERRERRGEQFRSLVNDVLDLTSPGIKHWTLGDPREQLRRLGPWRLLGGNLPGKGCWKGLVLEGILLGRFFRPLDCLWDRPCVWPGLHPPPPPLREGG